MFKSKNYGIASDTHNLYIPVKAKIDPFCGGIAYCACMPGWFGKSAAEESLSALETAVREESQNNFVVTEGIQEYNLITFCQYFDMDCYFYEVPVRFTPGSFLARTAYGTPIVRGTNSEIMQYPLFPTGSGYNSPHYYIFESILQIKKSNLPLISSTGLVDFLRASGMCPEILKETEENKTSNLEEFSYSNEKSAFDAFWVVNKLEPLQNPNPPPLNINLSIKNAD